MKNTKHDISDSISRFDAEDKSEGKSLYIADINYPDMCYARTIRSEIPRGRIKEVYYPSFPPGYNFVDYRDVPGKNVVKMLIDDWPFFAHKKVNYIGEPIALLVGPDREILDELFGKVEVKYESADAIFTLDEGLSNPENPIYGNDNLFASYQFKKGDFDFALKNAKHIFEDVYETGPQEHIYMEPQGMVGLYKDDKITVLGSMQCPFYIKNALVQGLGCPPEKVQIIQATTGGAFGGKEEYPSLIAGHVAFAALKMKKPVKLIFDRDEDILVTTKRHPSRVRIKAAVNNDNKVIGINADIVLDGGARAGLSAVVLQRAMFAAANVYNIPNATIRGRVAATNNVPFGAYRGFGAPQAIFAIEMHMRHIARALGENPQRFKQRHFVKQGDSTITSGTLHNPVKFDQINEALSKLTKTVEDSSRENKSKLSGRGISYFLHGCGFTGSGEQDIIKAKVRLKRGTDKRVTILIANVEMGQGPQTTLPKVVAETLGISPEMVDYPNPDTDIVPDSGPTVASRTAMVVGGLLRKAALKMKERWNEAGEIETEAVYKQPRHLKWDQEKFIGDAYPDYAWGAVAIGVEVDPLTFEINVTDINTVFDVGHALDKMIVDGQIDGGIAQGIGWASIEKMEFQKGVIRQRNITDYIIPSSKELPAIGKALIDNPYPEGPYGAKGAGELTFIGAAPAFAAAVENAIGKEINKIPITPEYLMEVLKNEK